MAPGETNNKPNPAPSEQPSNPIDQALEAFQQKNLSHAEIVGQLESLKQQVTQESNFSLNVDEIPALRSAVVSEVDSGGIDSLFTDVEQKNTLLADLDKRLDEIEQIVQQKATPEASAPPLFSKEGMKKTLDDGMKNLGTGLTTLAAVLEQIKEQISISIGAHLEMLAPFIGANAAILRSFIGEDRIQLSKTLNAAKITLPMAAFIHARKSIEAVRGETAANVRGWTAERMSFVLVQKLTLAGVTGKEVEGDLEQKITDAVKTLRDEVLVTPLNGGAVNFAEAPKTATPRLTNTIMEGKQIDILSDGSVTVAGQKWKMQKSGKEIAINRAEPATGGTLILEVQEGASRQTIVLTEDIPGMMNSLASATNTKVEAKAKDQTVLIEFVRNLS